MRTVDLSRGESPRLFNTIHMEISSRCNRSCSFCPVHGNQRPDELMSMDLIASILQQLRDLKWNGRIALHNFNEPLRDKRHPEIIKGIRAVLPRACIMIITNGDYLKSRSQLKNLYDIGITQMEVNCYNAAEHVGNPSPEKISRGVELARSRWQQIKGWVDELGLDQKSSIYMYVRPPARVIRVSRKWEISEADRRLGSHSMQNVAGSVPWFKPPLPQPLALGCVRPWRMLIVGWTGQVMLCCNDYHGTISLGSLKNQTIEQIWNSDEMNKYRLFLQNKRRDLPLCDVCDHRGGVYPHMVERVTFGAEKDALMLAVEL